MLEHRKNKKISDNQKTECETSKENVRLRGHYKQHLFTEWTELYKNNK